ncbi:MAG: ATP-binding protein [Tissierellia bacterium]|nr:ATP-binding protein [Tissierellia bacterium]NLM06909.1 ATP-binding protein [Tissierellia bacterium]
MNKNESKHIEYKEDIGKKEKEIKNFKAEISPFLNSNTGGVIFLGHTNDGEEIEFKSEEEKFKKFQQWEETISNWVTEGFEPDIRDLVLTDTSDGKFKIIGGKEKPYYFTDGKGINYNGAYERIGSHKVQLTRERFQYLLSNSAPTPYDMGGESETRPYI